MGTQAMSDEVVYIAVYHHFFCLVNHTHRCQKAEFCLLCTPAYTGKDKHIFQPYSMCVCIFRHHYAAYTFCIGVCKHWSFKG